MCDAYCLIIFLYSLMFLSLKVVMYNYNIFCVIKIYKLCHVYTLKLKKTVSLIFINCVIFHQIMTFYT